jgi:glycosyltransferase involved in cell wall biosynthesis
MESSDATAEIAREFGARVVSHPQVGYADPARNFGMEQATSEWVLMVDADERVPPALARELRRLAESGEFDLVEVPRKNLWLGRWLEHGGEWPNEQRRFFRKGTISWPAHVHSRPEPGGRMLTLPARQELALVHDWVGGIDDFLRRLSTYSALEADRLAVSQHGFRRRHVVVQPLREFWQRFVLGEGHRDGFDGLVVALAFAAYRLFALLQHWERAGPRDFGDRGQGLGSFVLGLARDRTPPPNPHEEQHV